MSIKSTPCYRCNYSLCQGPCICRVDAKPVAEHIAANDCPAGRFPGMTPREVEAIKVDLVGDVLARAIHRATGLKPCGGCKKRKDVMNKIDKAVREKLAGGFAAQPAS
jgi:hypothetical protein